MKKQEYTFSEYMDNSKKLFKMLFGEKLYKQLEKTPLKEIDWEGIDITTCKILATCPNIKERFNKEWVEYFSERDYTVLDLYLQSVFHYGYQQCVDSNYSLDRTTELLEQINKRIEEQKKLENE